MTDEIKEKKGGIMTEINALIRRSIRHRKSVQFKTRDFDRTLSEIKTAWKQMGGKAVGYRYVCSFGRATPVLEVFSRDVNTDDDFFDLVATMDEG